MKLETWKLWLLAGMLFLFVCIMQLIDKKYFSGLISALLASSYICLSINNYKKNNSKTSQIQVYDAGMAEVDIKIKKLIEKGKRIQAIKYCRMVTRVDLKKAEKYVDLLSKENLNK